MRSSTLPALSLVLVSLLFWSGSTARADHGWRDHQGYRYFYNEVGDARYWYYHPHGGPPGHTGYHPGRGYGQYKPKGGGGKGKGKAK